MIQLTGMSAFMLHKESFSDEGFLAVRAFVRFDACRIGKKWLEKKYTKDWHQ